MVVIDDFRLLLCLAVSRLSWTFTYLFTFTFTRFLVVIDVFRFLGEMQSIAFRLMLSSCVSVCVCVSVCMYAAFVDLRKTV